MITAVTFSSTPEDDGGKSEVTFFTSDCDNADYEDDTTSIEEGEDRTECVGSSLVLPYSRKDIIAMAKLLDDELLGERLPLSVFKRSNITITFYLDTSEMMPDRWSVNGKVKINDGTAEGAFRADVNELHEKEKIEEMLTAAVTEPGFLEGIGLNPLCSRTESTRNVVFSVIDKMIKSINCPPYLEEWRPTN